METNAYAPADVAAFGRAEDAGMWNFESDWARVLAVFFLVAGIVSIASMYAVFGFLH